MRRAAALILAVLLLSGCGTQDDLDRVISLRERLLNCESCSFTAKITADYADELYTFSMQCAVDNQGEVVFTVLQPDSISGITGKIGAEGGKLTFDGQVLAFPLLADGQLSPISVPWLLMRTLRGGYLSACGKDGELLKVQINDSYEENALQLDIWLDQENTPIAADILYEGRRMLSVQVNGLEIL